MTSNDLEIKIIYRDHSLIIIDKPGGLLAVPGRGSNKQDCVVARIKQQVKGMINQPAVHRLDMATSGLMILAIDRTTHKKMCQQFAQQQVNKRYIGLLDGVVKGRSGKIEIPFRLDPDNRPFQVYDPIHGKMGITLWKKLSVEEGRTRVEFTPLTGRTHQLRLHSAHSFGLGVPIIGDSLYGTGKEGDRMLLHAYYLNFNHPTTGEELHFTLPVPF